MQIIAFNGSPRKKGNTSTIINAMLEGAESAGATTGLINLHDDGVKGCYGCGSCNTKFGECAQKDALSPYLSGVRDADAIIIGCPIYMYRVSGQVKLFVDRMYSYYSPKPEGGGYNSELPPGKKFSIVTSQGAADPDQYSRSLRWLAGMAGTGFGMEDAGSIIHTNSRDVPADKNEEIMARARELGKSLVKK